MQLETQEQLEKLQNALTTALAYLDRGTPEPYPAHTCGNDMGCDMNCVDVAHYAEFKHEAITLLRATVGDLIV